MVLLKNANHTLPFTAGVSLAVVGPMAFQQQGGWGGMILQSGVVGGGTKRWVVGPCGVMQHTHLSCDKSNQPSGLLSDYAGAQICYTGGYSCMDTIASALTRANTGGHTASSIGVQVDSSDASGIPAALSVVKAADATVLVLGITKTQEHEGIDRSGTALPGLQESFALQVVEAAGGKPVVLVLCNGGIVSVNELVEPTPAIIEAFNPAVMGPRALADSIFGAQNRWGKRKPPPLPHPCTLISLHHDSTSHHLPPKLHEDGGASGHVLLQATGQVVPLLHRRAALPLRGRAQLHHF